MGLEESNRRKELRGPFQKHASGKTSLLGFEELWLDSHLGLHESGTYRLRGFWKVWLLQTQSVTSSKAA